MPAKCTTHLLLQLRNVMNDLKYVTEPIQAYIIPSNDAHNSEYLADCDNFRSFISGFTGSAGTAIVTHKEALLWTDGRYYLQATHQLDSNWQLMKEGIPSTPTQGSWLCKSLPPGSGVGVDPKLYTNHMWIPLQRQLESAGHRLIPICQNLVQVIWNTRPHRPCNAVHPLTREFTGKAIHEKLNDIYERMTERNADLLVVTALDEIAWLLNLRGSDIHYNPIFFAYVIITTKSIMIFINKEQITVEIKNHLKDELDHIRYEICGYDTIETYLTQCVEANKQTVWLSENASYALTRLIPGNLIVSTDITPIALMKAIKNPTEIRGMRNAHVKDAVALCMYFSWLERNVPHGKVTEISGANKLQHFRSLQKDFVGPSFSTISSVGAHGAIIHYEPQPDTCIPLTMDALYLCDSGGQYKDGTTDVTRTLHFGTPTKYEKECFTRVLKGQIRLATTIFPSKIKGNCLDSFARQYLWEAGLDYAHGTGHGIGSYLNVHEGPMGISWRAIAEDPGLEAGMFLSNEPGYYEDGKFGIRLEDIVQIVPTLTPYNYNNRGFLTFDTITLVPKQTKLIVPDLLTTKEIEYLNMYHKKCRECLIPLLEEMSDMHAKDWLIRETEPIAI